MQDDRFRTLYASSEAFKERFDEMAAAIEQLPTELKERARSYDYPQLHRACVDSDCELVEALLVLGVPADAYTYSDDEDDETPLVWLAQAEDMSTDEKIRVAKILLFHGADPEEGEAAEVAEEVDERFSDFLRGQRAGPGDNK